MIDSLYIAWRYVGFNKIKTLTLIGCITVIAFLPLALELLLSESERQLMARATSTPLVVGAKGSAVDLVMNTLYFTDELPEAIKFAEADRVEDSGLALPIPIYARFRARGYPIVGTSLDYFDFRGLQMEKGRQMAIVGDAVLGAIVAEELRLKPDEGVVSSPENLFYLAGVYPLKLNIVGVLKKSHTADDRAVFVDLKTAWIIEGLGHGHTDLLKSSDASVVLERSADRVTANAKLPMYSEISKLNLDSFHFHGDTSQYHISALIAVPKDAKAGTILRGRYIANEGTAQIVQPKEVVGGLLQNIFRVKSFIDGVIAFVGLATVLAVVLVFALSLRLRQREIQTIFKLGCSGSTIAQLVAAEILIILSFSAVLCGIMLFVTQSFSNELVRLTIIR